MAVTATSGMKFYISSAAVTDAAADTLVEIEALTYVEVGEVETIGDFGDEAADITFTSIGDSRTRHIKGARDAGVLVVTCGRDRLDPGQEDMIGAEAGNDQWAFKVEFNDEPSGYTPTYQYFRGLVMSQRVSPGGANDITRIIFNVGITSEVFEDPIAVIP